MRGGGGGGKRLEKRGMGARYTKRNPNEGNGGGGGGKGERGEGVDEGGSSPEGREYLT